MLFVRSFLALLFSGLFGIFWYLLGPDGISFGETISSIMFGFIAAWLIPERNILAIFHKGRHKNPLETVKQIPEVLKWEQIKNHKPWPRPDTPQDLTEDQVKYIWLTAKCPYCQSDRGLYDGPRGGLSVNLFCGNPDCGSRFNVTEPGFIGFPGAGSAAIPAWGQYTGFVPENFRERMAKEALGEIKP